MANGKFKIAVGMSGGVDSTVAALLLKQQGHAVFGVTMSVWDGGPQTGAAAELVGGCYGADEPEEIARAKNFAKQIGITHYVVDLRPEYKSTVLDYFRAEYLAGRTPNPCVRCNRLVKLGLLIERTRQQCGDFDFFATGHYARIENSGGVFLLKKGADEKKDQSYFLWGLTQRQLSKLMFPLGGLSKPEVRELALNAGLKEAAELEESQDFIGGGDYCCLFNPGESKPGPVYDVDGKQVGEHKGIVHYTLGQRKGIGVGGLKDPLYVVGIDAARNAVIVGPREKLFSKGMLVRDVNSARSITAPLAAKVKIRQQHIPVAATLYPPENGAARVEFAEPQFAVTPGQSAVFYDGDTVAAGAIISEKL
jgi:tRNA-specific 2-thiouridylase